MRENVGWSTWMADDSLMSQEFTGTKTFGNPYSQVIESQHIDFLETNGPINLEKVARMKAMKLEATLSHNNCLEAGAECG